MKEFSGTVAEHYDRNILKVLPGYDLVHQIAASILQVALPAEAQILLVGAGTCKEVQMLAPLSPHWTFCAQDISSDMLDVAKSKLSLDLLERTTFVHGTLDAIPKMKFDAVVSLFVMHFVAEIEQKSNFLHQLRLRIADSGILLLGDLMTTDIPASYPTLANVYQSRGMSPAGIERSIQNLQNTFFPISDHDLLQLLHHNDLARQATFFQALDFVGNLVTPLR